MVFYQIGAGICVGIMVPQIVHNNIYLVIANSFIRPHLRFRMYLANKNKNLALDTNMIGSYVKDIFASALFFFLVIGPTVKGLYFPSAPKKTDQEGDDKIYKIEQDKYSQILKNMKNKQMEKLQDQQENIEESQEKAKPKKISFEEYERLVKELEDSGKFIEIERQNPRSVFYQDRR